MGRLVEQPTPVVDGNGRRHGDDGGGGVVGATKAATEGAIVSTIVESPLSTSRAGIDGNPHFMCIWQQSS
jgi:hypothetical protein